jgi:hypothetical protein
MAKNLLRLSVMDQPTLILMRKHLIMMSGDKKYWSEQDGGLLESLIEIGRKTDLVVSKE